MGVKPVDEASLSADPIPLFGATPEMAAAAAALAARWGLPLVAAAPPAGAWQLRLDAESGLALHGGSGVVRVDFVTGAVRHRRQFGGGRGQALARAVGVRGAAPSVIDATAGLGGDSFVLATLGCRVTLLERSPVVAALLADGLQRAAADPEVAPIVARMALIAGESREQLPNLSADVIYLDPMFPERRKRAQVKKGMQALQALLGHDSDAAALLSIARQVARRRVVVKRPATAPPLADTPPHATIETRSHRFDLYQPLLQ